MSVFMSEGSNGGKRNKEKTLKKAHTLGLEIGLFFPGQTRERDL